MATLSPFARQYGILRAFLHQIDDDLEVRVVGVPQGLSRDDLPNVSDDIRTRIGVEARLSRWADTLPEGGRAAAWDADQARSLSGALTHLFRDARYPAHRHSSGMEEALGTLYADIDALTLSPAYDGYMRHATKVATLQNELSALSNMGTAAPTREVERKTADLDAAERDWRALGGRSQVERAIALLERSQGDSAVAAFANLVRRIHSARLSTPEGMEYLSVTTEPRRLDAADDHHWQHVWLGADRHNRARIVAERMRGQGASTPLFACDTIDMELTYLRLLRPWFDPRGLIRRDYDFASAQHAHVSKPDDPAGALIPGHVEGLVLARRAKGLHTKVRPDPARTETRVSLIDGRLASRQADAPTAGLRRAARAGLQVQNLQVEVEIDERGHAVPRPVVIDCHWYLPAVTPHSRRAHGTIRIHHRGSGSVSIPLLEARGREGSRIPSTRLMVYGPGMAPLHIPAVKIWQLRARPVLVMTPNRAFTATVVAEAGEIGGAPTRQVPLHGARLQFVLPSHSHETPPGLVGQALTDRHGRATGYLPLSDGQIDDMVIRVDAEGYALAEIRGPFPTYGDAPLERSITLTPTNTSWNWDDTKTARIVGVVLGHLPMLPDPDPDLDW